MSVIGFDIGNEACYIAIARSGGIEVIDNEYSSRMTPSYVGFTEKSRVFGIAARSKLTTNINNTVFGFKTILGKKFSNALHELKYLSFEVRELLTDEIGIVVRYLNEERVFSVQQIMAMMLTKLKTLAEAKIGSKVRECVISVPIFYTDRQRRAMLDAAAIADLKVLKLMNEPTAVALSYGFYRQNLFKEPKTVVFVDLGQSALTVTAGMFIENMLINSGCVWNNGVGGRDFDGVLVKYFAAEIKNKYNLDVMSNKKAVMMLMLECETLKKQMSMNSQELNLNIECLMNGIDVSCKMKRDLFEQLSTHLLLEVENTMKNLLLQTQLDCKDIHEVQIVGGSCRIAALKNIIFRVFGQYPHATLNQDEAVARGCALQSAFLSPTLKTKEYVIDDIQPFAIKMSTCLKNPVVNELEVFPRFHKAPACKKITFNFKTPFFLKVFYSDTVPGLSEIGKYHFSDFPSDINFNGDVRLKVISVIDINGIFNVTSAKLVVKDLEKAPSMLSEQTAIVHFDGNKQSGKECMKSDDSSKPLSEPSITDESNIEAPAQTIKSFDLTIQTDVPSLSNLDLNQLAAKEKEFINADLLEKKIEDLRNIVEEYVYQSREKLSDELKEFVSYDDRKNIFKILDATELWLYNCDNLQEDDYSQKLDELRSHFDPIRARFQQFMEVELVLNEFKNVLESSSSNFQMLTSEEKDYSLDENDVKIFKKVFEQKYECATRYLNVIHDANLHNQLPIQADAIRTEMLDFQEKAKVFFNKTVARVVQEKNSTGDQTRDSGSLPEESIYSESNCGQNEESESSAETSSDIQPPTEEQFSGVKIV